MRAMRSCGRQEHRLQVTADVIRRHDRGTTAQDRRASGRIMRMFSHDHPASQEKQENAQPQKASPWSANDGPGQERGRHDSTPLPAFFSANSTLANHTGAGAVNPDRCGTHERLQGLSGLYDRRTGKHRWLRYDQDYNTLRQISGLNGSTSNSFPMLLLQCNFGGLRKRTTLSNCRPHTSG